MSCFLLRQEFGQIICWTQGLGIWGSLLSKTNLMQLSGQNYWSGDQGAQVLWDLRYRSDWFAASTEQEERRVTLRDGIIFSVWGQSAVPERFTPLMLRYCSKGRFVSQVMSVWVHLRITLLAKVKVLQLWQVTKQMVCQRGWDISSSLWSPRTREYG